MGAISLPDPNDEQRRAEIKAEAANYQYNNDIGLPLINAPGPRDANMPDHQLRVFSTMMRIRFNIQAICERSGLKFQKPKPVGNLSKFLELLKSGGNPLDYFAPDLGFVTPPEANRAQAIDDYFTKVFIDRTPSNQGNAVVPEMALKWDSDKTFAYNFLAGPSPSQIRQFSYQSRPQDFRIESLVLSSVPGFEGDSVAAAMSEGRMFYVDYSGLKSLYANIEGAPAANAAPRYFSGEQAAEWKYIYAAVGAFAVPRGQKHLLPVAIQCGPSAEGNAIYSPADGNAWKMARVCLLAAHNNHHEVIAHLGLTHLLIDPINMATRIHLHPNHPVHALLHPHFEGTAAINVGARTSLILPERGVDRLVGSKIEMNYPFLKEHRLAYSFKQNYLPDRLRLAGTNDKKTLPSYPFRDDGIMVWDAIESWVTDYVQLWYQDDAAVRRDGELQNWAREIAEVGKVKDFGTYGGITSISELVGVLTMTIFTAGPQHAAVNFSQGHEMLSPVVNPLAGYAPAPHKKDHSFQDFLNILPPLDVAVETWGILTLLAGVFSTRLGDYRQVFANEERVAGPLKTFNDKLKGVEAAITQANQQRRALYDLEYLHLLPSRIPASINI